VIAVQVTVEADLGTRTETGEGEDSVILRSLVWSKVVDGSAPKR